MCPFPFFSGLIIFFLFPSLLSLCCISERETQVSPFSSSYGVCMVARLSSPSLPDCRWGAQKSWKDFPCVFYLFMRRQTSVDIFTSTGFCVSMVKPWCLISVYIYTYLIRIPFGLRVLCVKKKKNIYIKVYLATFRMLCKELKFMIYVVMSITLDLNSAISIHVCLGLSSNNTWGLHSFMWILMTIGNIFFFLPHLIYL